jgi:hypothetical protein
MQGRLVVLVEGEGRTTGPLIASLGELDLYLVHRVCPLCICCT